MLLLAHRGASADAPENTLSAFREAIAQKADGVELDVQRCSTGEVIVCHDEHLERLSGRNLEVAHTSWRTLRDLDVGTRLGFLPDRIPLLEEVLAALPPTLRVNVELKCETLEDRGLTEAAARIIRDCGAEDRVIVSSFNAFCLWRLAAVAPALPRGYLVDPDRSFAVHGLALTPLVSTHSVHPHWSQCSDARIQLWKGAGLRIAAWTVDDVGEARRLQSLGVEYLITNRPGQLRDGLQRD